MAIRDFDGQVPDIAATAWVDETALVIGHVRLAEHVSIWPMSVVRGDIHTIAVGKYSNIQDGAVLHVSHDSRFKPGGAKLEIGDYVTVGHQATLHGCYIGNRCLIGMRAIVMDDVRINDDVMLAAGALVPPGKELLSGYLYTGSPAKQTRLLTESEREFISYSAKHYAELKLRHCG